MRRTFQDLARAAKVNDLATRAVSGNATEAMQMHHSTVSPAEVKEGLAKVISLEGHLAGRVPSRPRSGDGGGTWCVRWCFDGWNEKGRFGFDSRTGLLTESYFERDTGFESVRSACFR